MVEFDFSKVKRLKEVNFKTSVTLVKGFAQVFNTITHKHNKDFEKVSCRLPPGVNGRFEVQEHFNLLREAGLERALIGLVERCEICLKFVLEVDPRGTRWRDEEMKEVFQDVFPEIMKRGIVLETLEVEPF